MLAKIDFLRCGNCFIFLPFFNKISHFLMTRNNLHIPSIHLSIHLSITHSFKFLFWYLLRMSLTTVSMGSDNGMVSIKKQPDLNWWWPKSENNDMTMLQRINMINIYSAGYGGRLVTLTQLLWDKMAAISQVTFSEAFSTFVFWFKFHWSLFPRIQLTISRHWFR